MKRITISVTVFLSCVFATPAQGEHVPVSEYLDYVAESGAHANPGADAVIVYEHLVIVDDAAWLRLYFAHTILGDQSFVRMTSLQDGQTQELDAAGMLMWGDSSAYFNGNAVFVELIGAPGTARNEIIFERVAIERAPAEDGLCGICKVDNRVPSNFDWACRLMPGGCSGVVWNKRSCVLTAGHCSILGDIDTAQFRVPNSSSNCELMHPPVSDQFPITGETGELVKTGKDWSVLSIGDNDVEQHPYERYGARRLLATEPPEVDDILLNVGYGLDDQCQRTQTQQRHTGPLLAINASKLDFNIDSTNGNSGGPLLKDDRIVGVFNACTANCVNFGTRSDYPPFVNGRKLECPSPGDFAPKDFAIPMGDPGAGNLTSLQDSDDDRLVIGQRAALAPTLPNIRLDVSGTAPFNIIRAFHFTVEARATARPVTVPQRISLFNFDTGGYEIVDERIATPDDRAVSIDITADPSRFLDPTNDEATSRVEWFDPGATFFVAWGAEIDFVEWIVDP